MFAPDALVDSGAYVEPPSSSSLTFLFIEELRLIDAGSHDAGETQSDVRRDLRSHRVFTIDPETAKDLDDALHVVKNDDGTFEVGVHIADVSHFVKVRFLPFSPSSVFLPPPRDADDYR